MKNLGFKLLYFTGQGKVKIQLISIKNKDRGVQNVPKRSHKENNSRDFSPSQALGARDQS